jgi:hypothetical protein
MKMKAYRLLERIFGAIETWAQGRKERFAYCSDCGRNRYTGMSCIVMQQIHPCDMGSR